MFHSAETIELVKELFALSERRRRHSAEMRKWMNEKYDMSTYGLIQRTLTWMTEESWEMAKKIADSRGKDKGKADFRGFANVELTIDQKAEMKEWIRDLDAVHVELDEMAASGYKMTFQKSEATGAYQATAFCMDKASPNAGFILAAFAPHWLDALSCLAYKHAIVCEGVWPSKDEGTGDLWG